MHLQIILILRGLLLTIQPRNNASTNHPILRSVHVSTDHKV